MGRYLIDTYVDKEKQMNGHVVKFAATELNVAIVPSDLENLGATMERLDLILSSTKRRIMKEFENAVEEIEQMYELERSNKRMEDVIELREAQNDDD